MTNHILIIWPSSAIFFEKIENEIINFGFKIIEKKEYDHEQKVLSDIMYYIYDINKELLDKKKIAKQYGKKFLIYKIEQNSEAYKIAKTNSGLQITIGNVFELKEKLRANKKLTHVHITNNNAEFLQNEKAIRIFLDYNINSKYNTLKDFLNDLEKYTPYVILRRETISEEFIQKLINKEEDLDLLITSKKFIQKNLKLKKIFNLNYDNKYKVNIANKSIWVDFSYIGDGELDAKWQRSLLNNRLKMHGFWICDYQNLFFSTLYRSIFLDTSPKIKNLEILLNSEKTKIIEQLGNNLILQDCLKNFLLANGYYAIKPINRKYYFAYDKVLELEVYKFSINDLLIPMRKSHLKIFIKSQISLWKFFIKRILGFNSW